MPASASRNRPEDLVEWLDSDAARLKALREIKNQIIGNRTKKLAYIKLGAVPRVAAILASAAASGDGNSESGLVVQSAAALGSFACGVDAGVKAVLSSGAFPHLVGILSSGDEKVVEAGARSLKMIFQSKLAPKYNFLEQENMDFLLKLLKSENESVTELAASIIAHSCDTGVEQKALFDSGVLDILMKLLSASINQRDASLDSLAAIFKDNPELVAKFTYGRGFTPIVELIKDRYPRTRLLACVCLIVIGQASPSHQPGIEIKSELISVLAELLKEPGGPGDEAPFALVKLVAGNEDLQKLATDANVVDKLCTYLQKVKLLAKRLQGLLLALAELCSRLECCRTQLLQNNVLDLVVDALKHDSDEVRIAACTCMRSITRSVKSLSAGCFTKENIVAPLVQLLHDPSTSVQVVALGTISNIVVHFSPCKTIFSQCGAVKQLVNFTKSMDPVLRLNGILALRNMIFLSDSFSKDSILLELTASTLASLVSDAEPSVQEQALGFVRNLVDGSMDYVDYVFAEDGLIINAVARQIWSSVRTEVCIQGMYAFSNIASVDELHKELVMHHLLSSPSGEPSPSIILKYLQSNDSQLRTASVWCLANLTYPNGSGASTRIARLRNVGIISQIKHMVNDPCFDVKFRVRTILEQCVTDTNC